MAYKICEYCGEQFEASRSSQIYCSKECRLKKMRERHITKIRASCTTVKKKSLLEWCNENGERGSLLLSEYSSKNELSFEEIPAGSHKIANWVCGTCGYEWGAIVVNRTTFGSNCPSCAGRVRETNNLYLWCMNNGERGQRILLEYSSENELPLEEITPMSKKKVWWKCSTCEYEWKVPVLNRVSGGTDCPNCNKANTSYGEQILYYILQRELKEHKVLNRAKVEGYEVDVFIPDLRFGIEYAGYNYHADRIGKDKEKKDALKAAGYNIITILEKRSIDGDLECNFSFVRGSILNPDEMLNYLKSYIKENYGLDVDVSLSDDEKEICKRNSAKQYIDIDEVILLQVSGKKNRKIAEILNCTVQLLWHRKNIFTKEELAQKEENIECVYRFTRFGDSAEKIASDFELDLDFVEKIQSFIKKYENGYKAPVMEESTLEVEEGDNNNEEESISNFNDDNGDDEFIWL